MRPHLLALAACCLALAGCLTHVPPPAHHRYLEVAWADGWQEALDRAQRTQKPILLVLVAGRLNGAC